MAKRNAFRLFCSRVELIAGTMGSPEETLRWGFYALYRMTPEDRADLIETFGKNPPRAPRLRTEKEEPPA